MKNIAVINAYGDKNIGDAAILNVSLSFIEKTLGHRGTINVFCEDAQALKSYKSQGCQINTYQLPYGYTIKGKTHPSTFTKFTRFAYVLSNSLILACLSKIHPSFSPKQGLFEYINILKNSDSVIGMGGGYFTTKHKYTDYFGLFLTLLPIYITHFFNKKILFLPMSFGSFASNQHQLLTYRAIKGDIMILRDTSSLDFLKQIDREDRVKEIYSPDMALYFNSTKKINADQKLKSQYIVLTAREWLPDQKQKLYEQTLANLVEHAWEKYHLNTVFIAMAHNPIEDDDNKVGLRVFKQLKNKKIFEIKSNLSPQQAQDLINKARVAVCTRLHSAILATTVDTPFITIAYGSKTPGYMKDMGLLKWNIDIEKVNFKLIKDKFDSLLDSKNYFNFINIVSSKKSQINKYQQRVLKELGRVINYNV